jgi:heme-degrading monooxygenase HmoA
VWHAGARAWNDRYPVSMIVRVLTARVRPDRAGQFNALLRQQLPLLRQHDGLVYAKLARQVHPDSEEVILFEEWRDSKSLYGWAGPDINKPRLFPGSEKLVESVSVTHYEALDVPLEEEEAG